MRVKHEMGIINYTEILDFINYGQCRVLHNFSMVSNTEISSVGQSFPFL